eukprot:1156805-Pelagomonas_calceolata.AAC.7
MPPPPVLMLLLLLLSLPFHLYVPLVLLLLNPSGLNLPDQALLAHSCCPCYACYACTLPRLGAAPATPATPAPSLVLELPHLALEVHHRALVLSPPVLQLRLLAEVLRVSDAPWDGGGLCAAASLLQLPPPLLLALQLAP